MILEVPVEKLCNKVETDNFYSYFIYLLTKYFYRNKVLKKTPIFYTTIIILYKSLLKKLEISYTIIKELFLIWQIINVQYNLLKIMFLLMFLARVQSFFYLQNWDRSQTEENKLWQQSTAVTYTAVLSRAKGRAG